MATEEQLKVTIQTAADLSGAKQVQGALQQLTAQQVAANDALRRTMAAGPQSIQAFRQNVKEIGGLIGQPTLGPEAFGISADGVSQAVLAPRVARAPAGPPGGPPVPPQMANEIREVGVSAHFTGQEFARMGLAFIGAGVGLSGFTAIGNIAHSTLQNIITSTIALGDAQRSNTITLGQSAAGFQQWAATASQQTGFTQRALLEAGTTAQQFGRTIGFGPERVQGLVQMATVLAQIHGLDVDETMKLLTAALQGSEQAANQLNLQLDDSYVAFTQINDVTGEVFAQLDPGTQAWLRYKASLGEAGDQAKTTSPEIDKLRDAERNLNLEWEHLVKDIGPPLLDTLAKIATGIDDIYTAHGPGAGPAADPVRDAIQNAVNRLPSDLGKPVQDAVAAAQDLLANNERALRDRQAGLARDVFSGEYIDIETGATVDLADAEQRLTEADQRLAESQKQVAASHTVVADAADRAAASEAERARRAAEAAALAERQAALDAARQNVISQTTERVRLQHEAVNLSAEEARIRLSMMPTMEHIAALQRDMTEQQLRAQLAGLPATQALENARAAEQHAQLIIQDLSQPIERRSQAYRDIINLRLRALPGLELGAFEANEPARLAAQAATGFGLQRQLLEIQQQRALAPVQAAEQQNQLVGQIVAATLQASKEYQQTLVQMPVTINVQLPDGSIATYTEMIEANGQAKQPPPQQISAVRRN